MTARSQIGLATTRVTESLTGTTRSVLQRSCDCGQHTGGGQPCGECEKKKMILQRRSAERTERDTAPPAVHEVLRSSGIPLDESTRVFMEPRFGRDFSHVQVHTDTQAASSAHAVSALAYTVGRDIVFGAGQYQPGTNAGQRLLAHELAHVAQQGPHEQALQGRGLLGGETGLPRFGAAGGQVNHGSALPIGLPSDPLEREADAVSEAVLSAFAPRIPEGNANSNRLRRTPGPMIQRRMTVNPTDTVPLPPGIAGPPDLLTNAVRGLINDTCPDGRFQVDQATGNVTAGNAQFCQQPPPNPPVAAAHTSSTPVGCRCLCDVVNDANLTTIAFHAGGPGTQPTRPIGAGPDNPTVAVDPNFQGQYLINGRWVDIPFHLIFAHELCGHALPLMRGTQVAPGPGPAGGTPPHERRSVDVERQIAAEHNPPLPRRPEDYSGGARQRP